MPDSSLPPAIIRNRHGERLDFTFQSGGPDASSLVVIGHGVTGAKDRPFLVALADELAAAGHHVLRLSFAGNGDSEGDFRECTITKEVEDLGAVLDTLGDRAVTYVGHSMGGAVGVLRASRDRRITRLVSLAGMAHTAAFAQREFGEVKPDEGVMWEDDDCPLSQGFMADMARIDTVVGAARTVKVPWLFVHGEADDVVPPQDTRDLLAAATAPTEAVFIPGANHAFAPPHTAAMTNAVREWLGK
jgi:pimeloyl-ACP methyl ester carboxylesterase